MSNRSVVRVCLIAASLLLVGAKAAQASTYFWTDWNTGPCCGGPFTATGSMTTNTATVLVTYTNALGVSFLNDGVGAETDYWAQGSGGSLGRNPATSPYTSTQVDNIPTGTDMIALNRQGTQSLHFSQAVANPVFAFVSLNTNGYSFRNQDFEILSLGGAFDGNDSGWWGCGQVARVVLAPFSPGNPTADTLYQLNQVSNPCGNEPHGTIRFLGSFSDLVWDSQSNENWNGFTVGIQGTAVEVFNGEVPEPGTLVLLGSGIAIAAVRLRRRRR
jgi:PEP-CTERM motif